ncbi:Gfo/Idh/MocA family protein [Paenibacillus eucommiae]|uniref:Dehydrogenase n=1 Tax=Paenibacillus eucommiae TaxID=1355755 RepID=A0ABS4J0L0_9BACL|nr:Gfo/Idh/MocA family oxidoreductase [Paenibacillus eucommiae]MBP1993343.1 putative dehydrogenase [Paenibacillus eucommiae]
MKTTMRIGILGFAHGHVNAYCEEWSKHPEYGITVAAGWDHDAIRLEKARQAFSLKAYSDLRELLACEDIQAVVVAAETSMHAELVELAAASGKGVILQKPMALTLSEADRIVAAVNRHQIPFTLAWQMRVDPQNLQMKQLLDSGELGRVFMVRRRHGLGVALDPAFADSWHVKPEHNRDMWADDSAHPIDFLHWLLGVPQSVTAEVESLYNPRIPMDNGIAIFRYSQGPIAEVNCSFTCTAGENTTEIICERGTIVQNFGDAVSCNIPRAEGAQGLKWFTSASGSWESSDIESPPNHSFRIRGLAKPLADFLHGEAGPIATAEEGRTSLRMVLASYVSAREGRRVSLDDPAIFGI